MMIDVRKDEEAYLFLYLNGSDSLRRRLADNQADDPAEYGLYLVEIQEVKSTDFSLQLFDYNAKRYALIWKTTNWAEAVSYFIWDSKDFYVHCYGFHVTSLGMPLGLRQYTHRTIELYRITNDS